MRFLFAVFLSFSGNRHRHVRISFEQQLTKMTYYWYYFSFSYYFFVWVQRSVCQPKESKQIHSQMLNNYIHLIIQKVHIREYILATTSQRWEMMMAELLISDEKTNDSWSHSNSYMSNCRSFVVVWKTSDFHTSKMNSSSLPGIWNFHLFQNISIMKTCRT